MITKTEHRQSTNGSAFEYLEPRELLWACLVGQSPEHLRVDPLDPAGRSLWDRLGDDRIQPPDCPFELIIRGTKMDFTDGLPSSWVGDILAGQGPAEPVIGRYEETLTPILEGGQLAGSEGIGTFSFFLDAPRPLVFQTITAVNQTRVEGVDAQTGALRVTSTGTVTRSEGVFPDLGGGFTGASVVTLTPSFTMDTHLRFTICRPADASLAAVRGGMPARGPAWRKNGNGSSRKTLTDRPPADPHPFAGIREGLKEIVAARFAGEDGWEGRLDEMIGQLAAAWAQQVRQPAGPADAEHPECLLTAPSGNGGTATPARTSHRTRPALADSFFPSAEDIQREIGHVLGKQLSPALEHWAARYGQVGRRNMYLWKWARQGVEVTTLPCVLPGLRDEVCDTKVLGVLLDVLLDDVADQNGDGQMLEELLALPSGGPAPDLGRLSAAQRAYARFTAEVWEEIQSRVRRWPCFEEYASLLRYDYLQLFNTMRFSHLLNRNPALLNLVEHDLYLPHNMHMMISATLDLMCSPGFDRAELGTLREAVWHAQCMGRIGNLTTTWERELGERDYTSGVYARALLHGDLTVADLLEGNRERIKAAVEDGQHEAYFLRRWQEHRRWLLSRRAALQSFDLAELVAGLQRLICLHLGSRGYK